MKLATLYSSSANSKLGRPFIKTDYFPLDCENYICLHGGGGNDKFPAKIYSLWQNVVNLILPYLEKNNIKIVQLGLGNERIINGAINLLGKTSIHQSAYLIQNSQLLIGNDSSLAHIAGALNVGVVALYGPTGEPHEPFWRNDKRSKCLHSHRNGKLPSFSSNEQGFQTINLIKPELVAKTILEILEISHAINETTLCIGEFFPEQSIEIIPDTIIDPNFMPNMIFNMRADYFFYEDLIYKNLAQRKYVVITDRPLNIEILKQLKHNVAAIVYEITDNHNIDFCKQIVKLGLPVNLITYQSEDFLKTILLDYLDLPLIVRKTKITLESVNNRIANYNNISIDEIKNKNLELNEKSMISASSLLLSANKFYLGKSYWKEGKDCNPNKLIAPALIHDKEWLDDTGFYRIYNNEL